MSTYNGTSAWNDFKNEANERVRTREQKEERKTGSKKEGESEKDKIGTGKTTLNTRKTSQNSSIAQQQGKEKGGRDTTKEEETGEKLGAKTAFTERGKLVVDLAEGKPQNSDMSNPKQNQNKRTAELNLNLTPRNSTPKRTGTNITKKVLFGMEIADDDEFCQPGQSSHLSRNRGGDSTRGSKDDMELTTLGEENDAQGLILQKLEDLVLNTKRGFDNNEKRFNEADERCDQLRATGP